jgi:hypothetical protein
VAARVAGSWPSLARRLVGSTIALPPARRRVVEHGLVLISPPN